MQVADLPCPNFQNYYLVSTQEPDIVWRPLCLHKFFGLLLCLFRPVHDDLLMAHVVQTSNKLIATAKANGFAIFYDPQAEKNKWPPIREKQSFKFCLKCSTWAFPVDMNATESADPQSIPKGFQSYASDFNSSPGLNITDGIIRTSGTFPLDPFAGSSQMGVVCRLVNFAPTSHLRIWYSSNRIPPL
jgi:hypothetical protein